MIAHTVTLALEYDGLAAHGPAGILVEITGLGDVCHLAVGHIDYRYIRVWLMVEVGGLDQ